ncbi:hypothetical protein SAMN06265784_104451 [Paraburkholderia susongensis]|uniref:Uncharacterized protein n=1 Tax=Paraburkholderia susongensis TaxID=1515439 RepID=A0A1X7KYC8_9BURK|nr:hypothetical protein SAMN06265784_104451 [Paraburkholderia susongensis]
MVVKNRQYSISVRPLLYLLLRVLMHAPATRTHDACSASL